MKSAVDEAKWQKWLVAPYAGAGIEIGQILKKPKKQTSSPPTRGRELKYIISWKYHGSV